MFSAQASLECSEQNNNNNASLEYHIHQVRPEKMLDSTRIAIKEWLLIYSPLGPFFIYVINLVVHLMVLTVLIAVILQGSFFFHRQVAGFCPTHFHFGFPV